MIIFPESADVQHPTVEVITAASRAVEDEKLSYCTQEFSLPEQVTQVFKINLLLLYLLSVLSGLDPAYIVSHDSRQNKYLWQLGSLTMHANIS